MNHSSIKMRLYSGNIHKDKITLTCNKRKIYDIIQ